jgi:GDPmannose 4,6-dehydratase
MEENNNKVALIIGVTGQDGSYLAELLLSKGYEVHGVFRRSSVFNTERIDHIFGKITKHYGDLTDMACLLETISKVKPDEIYNLGAQSHVKVSFSLEKYTTEVNALGVLNVLQCVKLLGLTGKTKVYQASTSEMFGNATDGNVFLNEDSLLAPVSPYGIAKLYAHHSVKYYREGHGVFACSGILFNHESERRGSTFVTKKIAEFVGKYVASLRDSTSSFIPMQIGNLDARRDWGFAKDYVYGMWLMLQQDTPDDFVLATGELHSVREFIEVAFKHVGVDIAWEGTGDSEKGVNSATGQLLVEVNEKFYRPIDVWNLIGDCTKAKKTLGWQHTLSFRGLVEHMVNAEIKKVL